MLTWINRARVAGKHSPPPPQEQIMYEHILIAVDGSDVSVRAEEQGFALAKALG